MYTRETPRLFKNHNCFIHARTVTVSKLHIATLCGAKDSHAAVIYMYSIH